MWLLRLAIKLIKPDEFSHYFTPIASTGRWSSSLLIFGHVSVYTSVHGPVQSPVKSPESSFYSDPKNDFHLLENELIPKSM